MFSSSFVSLFCFFGKQVGHSAPATHVWIHSIIYSFSLPFIHSFTHLFIHSFIHTVIQPIHV